MATINGTEGEDLIFGTTSSDSITGLGANDYLNANSNTGLDTGRDTLVGGDGDDSLVDVGPGDVLDGGAGRDGAYFQFGELTTDLVLVLPAVPGARATLPGGGSVVNVEGYGVNGSYYDDRIVTGGSISTIYASRGDDTIVGRARELDYLDGESGNDRIELRGAGGTAQGHGGHDTLVASLTGPSGSYDVMDGGTGDDLLLIERGDAPVLKGNIGNDTLVGADADDSLQGGTGDDLLVGGLGADTLLGGLGRDVFRYGSSEAGGDAIKLYQGTDDSIEVSAAGFGGGIVAGMDLVAEGRYVENRTGDATSAPGVGQFIGETDARTLWWDPDGTGAAPAEMIMRGVDPDDWSGSEIVVIA